MEHRPTLKNYCEQITFYGTVYIRHPGCDRLLFILPAYDPAPVLDQTAVLPPSSVSLESTGLSGFTADASDSSAPDAEQRLAISEQLVRGGVLHRLVLDACRVITNNQEGFLATDIDGHDRVPASTTILLVGTYYFHLATGTVLYKIVTDFAAWEFPEPLPSHWERPVSPNEDQALSGRYAGVGSSAMSVVVKCDDAECVVSGYTSCMLSSFSKH